MLRHITRQSLTFIAQCVVIGLAAAFVIGLFAPGFVQRLRGSAASSGVRGEAATSSRGPVSYADAVSRASPAVVNIYANKTTTMRSYYRTDPLTQRLLGLRAIEGPWVKKLDRSLGSGVIFSADGYVLTNNHVISGADDIQVLLDDGRVAKAQIIGSDAETDLAVLKIDAGNLPEIAVPEQASVDVGDVVLAIGNPVGLGKTVTMGIVSATGRQLRMSAYEDFIQTDAAINAGNSGGALVNSLGELIGINTAIYPRTPTSNGLGSVTQGAEGIGFAIPVTTAKAVLDQIIKHGRVIRGWIGAEYSDVTPERNATTRPQGVVVRQVAAESPAAQAALQANDVLLELDGSAIVDAVDLRNREAALAPGTKVRLQGTRGDQPFTADITLAQRPAPSTTGI